MWSSSAAYISWLPSSLMQVCKWVAHLEGWLIKAGKGLPGTIWLKLSGPQREGCTASCRHGFQ